MTDVTLPGNYDEVVGDDKEGFLRQCTDEYKPVVCLDVKSGSIIITLGGTEEEVLNTKTSMENDGIELESFVIAPLDSDDSGSSGAMIATIVIIIVVLLVVIAVGLWAYRWQQKQDEKRQQHIAMMSMENDIASDAGNTIDAGSTIVVKDKEEMTQQEKDSKVGNDGIEHSSSDDSAKTEDDAFDEERLSSPPTTSIPADPPADADTKWTPSNPPKRTHRQAEV